MNMKNPARFTLGIVSFIISAVTFSYFFMFAESDRSIAFRDSWSILVFVLIFLGVGVSFILKGTEASTYNTQFRRWGFILFSCLLSVFSFGVAIFLASKMFYDGRAEYNFITSIAMIFGFFAYHSIFNKPWSTNRKLTLLLVTFIFLFIILPEVFQRVLFSMLGFN